MSITFLIRLLVRTAGRQLSTLLVLPALLAVAGCGPTPPTYREVHAAAVAFDLPAADYYGVAWIDPDTLAFAVEERIVIASRDAEILRSFEAPLRQECVRHTFRGLGRLPTGEIGSAHVCTVDGAGPPEIANLIAVDATSLEVRNLGPTSQPPSWLAWRHDLTGAVYSVGDDLCATLYERTDIDQPLQGTVTAHGSTFDLGVDISADSDACPDVGRASYPAFGEDDRLAFMASANSGRGGQDLIDVPWAVIVLPLGGSPTQVLDGVRWPRGLTWNRERLIFSGTVGNQPGIWSIAADGGDLVRIADREASWLAVSPDGREIVTIGETLVGDEWATDVVFYHVGDL